ncbi:rhodanese-like domain-containing protein [Pedobacter antarcticus]|uniref:rhodanese-like domain-containing protein n=1 Tax=Pedobacter antarcticus TaxID=34086 RepID=UPI002930DD3C|nr:rhodanese-like domain-containing protein [Pedobacter antarcticus]
MKLLLITGLILFLIYIGYRTFRIANIDNEIEQHLKTGAVILDVRTETEFNTGHINGAINIPLSSLRKDSIPLNKSQNIITTCSHGLRSIKAVEILKSKGFSHVYNGGASSDLEEILNKKR